jgi:PST family polysaccharide transporter
VALGRAAFYNSLYMVIGNGGQMIASLGVFLYLARVLTPTDFGAMGMAAAIVDLLTVLARWGQVEGLLQRGADDQRIRSTSFWLLVAIGLANAAVIALLAQPIAWLTGTWVVASVMLLLVAVPLIGSLGQVNEAILRHEMRYRGIAVRNVVATVAGAAAAAILATLDFGVYALAAQKLVFTIVYTFSVIVARPWMPGFTFMRDEARRLLGVGFDVTISNTLQMANGRIVDLSIGFFLGVVALGMTRVAWRLYDFALQLVIAPLSSVSYSLFARVRNDAEALRQAYLQYVELITLTAAPIFVGVSLVSRDAIVLLAGEQWEESASVLAFLSLSVLASCMSMIFSPVMVATERTAIIRRQALLQTVANVILTVVAAQISVMAVVLAYVTRMYAFAAWNVVLMNRSADVTLGGFVKRIWPMLLALCGLVAAGLGARAYAADAPAIVRVLAVSAAGAAGYLGVLVLGDRLGLWRGFIGRLFQISSSVLRRKQPAPAAAE